jgi:hypothetical protein
MESDMVTIVIATLIILVLVLGEKVWWRHTPTWVDDIFSVVLIMTILVDAVLIGIKFAKVGGLL